VRNLATGASATAPIMDGGSASTNAPTIEVKGGLSFVSIAAGSATCGVTSGGVTYCWGDDEDGQLGPAAITTMCAVTSILSVPCSTVPVPEAGLPQDIVQVASSAGACALERTGAAYCWAMPYVKDTASGGYVTSGPPSLIPGNLVLRWLAVGSRQACGLTGVVDAFCWGRNFEGALGDGTTVDRNNPVLVSGGLKFTTLSAGQQTCGMATDGIAYCWGPRWATDGTTTVELVPVPIAGQP
jgi:alpha-tubulin suppressor-like RCC1 family protein